MALYQGTSLDVPQAVIQIQRFSPCRSRIAGAEALSHKIAVVGTTKVLP